MYEIRFLLWGVVVFLFIVTATKLPVFTYMYIVVRGVGGGVWRELFVYI